MKTKELEYKSVVEDRLLQIKEKRLDILILQRQNEELCRENNQTIEEYNAAIGRLEIEIENILKESGQKKIDTSVGYISFRSMPDSWTYDEQAIIAWCEKKKLPYFKIEKILKKQELKNDIEIGKIKAEEVEGLEVNPQEPKFNYKIREVF